MCCQVVGVTNITGKISSRILSNAVHSKSFTLFTCTWIGDFYGALGQYDPTFNQRKLHCKCFPSPYFLTYVHKLILYEKNRYALHVITLKVTREFPKILMKLIKIVGKYTEISDQGRQVKNVQKHLTSFVNAPSCNKLKAHSNFVCYREVISKASSPYMCTAYVNPNWHEG